MYLEEGKKTMASDRNTFQESFETCQVDCLPKASLLWPKNLTSSF